MNNSIPLFLIARDISPYLEFIVKNNLENIQNSINIKPKPRIPCKQQCLDAFYKCLRFSLVYIAFLLPLTCDYILVYMY